MARAFALATFVVGGLIIADLWAHPGPTNKVITFFGSESKLLAGR
jgi:hypothetical protein